MCATTANGNDDWITFAGEGGGGFSFAVDADEAELEEELIERQDWEGLVALRRRQADECPCILCTAGLAEALIADELYEEALEVLGPAEAEAPGEPLIGELILNTLHFLGRDLYDFSWTVHPRIVHLGAAALDRCHDLLARSEHPIAVGAIWHEAFAETYVDFDSDRLAEALRSDERFCVETEAPGRATVKLRS